MERAKTDFSFETKCLSRPSQS